MVITLSRDALLAVAGRIARHWPCASGSNVWKLTRFIFPAVFQQTGITSFPLIKNLQCKFGPGGQAHHIVLVEMKPGLSTDFKVRPIAVEGVLTVKPWAGPDGNTWALYHMLGEGVE